MSVQENLDAITQDIENAYEAVSIKGGILPENQGTANLSEAINSIQTGGGSSGGEIYSTEETRIGTWIDGRPLYRIVIQTTTNFNKNSSFTKTVNTKDLNIRAVTKLSGTIDSTSWGATYQLPYIERLSATENLIVSLFYNTSGGASNITIYSYWNSAQTNIPITLVIEYTRTTDQATIETPAILSTTKDTFSAIVPDVSSAARNSFIF